MPEGAKYAHRIFQCSVTVLNILRQREGRASVTPKVLGSSETEHTWNRQPSYLNEKRHCSPITILPTLENSHGGIPGSFLSKATRFQANAVYIAE